MPDIVIGILAVLAGLGLCFLGYWTLRLVLSIWGAVIGFGLGSALATWINDDSYLATALGWTIGIVLAVLFAALAYLYYAVGVILAFLSMGFTLGATVTAAIGVSWDWVIVLIGVVTGLALALLAIVFDLPMVLLVLLSSLGGASIAVAGVMLLSGVLETADFDSAAVIDDIPSQGWWSAAVIVVAAIGYVSQVRRASGIGSSRQAWEAPSAHRAG